MHAASDRLLVLDKHLEWVVSGQLEGKIVIG